MRTAASIAGVRRALVALLLCLWAARAAAQTTVALPSSGQTTTLSAAVPEQARVTLPAGVIFNVTNVNGATSSGTQTVRIDNIVLATATKQLRLSLMANAASFTPPVAATPTWSAGDVSWSNPPNGTNAWVNATRNNGTLSNSAFVEVATCKADTASCSTTNLSFLLAAKPTVKRSGTHTLVVTWKVESIGS